MAATFLDDLDFHLEGPTSKIVVLDAALRYRSSNARLFTIPTGFRCDLASVPSWLRWLAPPWQQSARAGVLHDCGYRWFEVWGVARDDVDGLFHEGLLADKTDPSRARLMTWAVQVFGGRAWQRWRATPEVEKGVKPDPVATP